MPQMFPMPFGLLMMLLWILFVFMMIRVFWILLETTPLFNLSKADKTKTAKNFILMW